MFVPMGLRERKKAATREALIDAAAKLFAERGVEQTTMDDIAAAAETSRTSVFIYFGYMESLLVEIGARYVRAIAAAVPINARRSPRATLYGLANAIADLAEREPMLIAAVAREMTHPDVERRRYAAERMQYPLLYGWLLQGLAAAGQLRHPKLVSTYSRQLVDLTSGTLVRMEGDYPVSRLRTELRHNVDLFWEGAVLPGNDS
jgi:AcrR family transcriptional regulator